VTSIPDPLRHVKERGADNFFREQSVDTTYERDDGYDVGNHMLHDEGPVQPTGTYLLHF
jgi:hypothetical protein